MSLKFVKKRIEWAILGYRSWMRPDAQHLKQSIVGTLYYQEPRMQEYLFRRLAALN